MIPEQAKKGTRVVLSSRGQPVACRGSKRSGPVKYKPRTIGTIISPRVVGNSVSVKWDNFKSTEKMRVEHIDPAPPFMTEGNTVKRIKPSDVLAYSITAPHLTGRLIVHDGRVILMEEPVTFFGGWPLLQVNDYCRASGWVLEQIKVPVS